ncbi:hemerythrin domain-containing protein [Paenibacillus sp. YYML68]|uniref:hemerythrin domain-containing protein n=1 Tax=Paenibacillus sp. YYML68 TaxID=2909250 RepID=UPI0024935C0C|nr:hemerythrin domain-containing protein [Paenibacillus sp. YYML68]
MSIESSQSLGTGLGEDHVTGLFAAVQRLQNEHAYILELLEEMEVQAVQIGKASTTAQDWSRLQHLRLWTIGVMQELEAHAKWEDGVLLPFLVSYFHLQESPSLAPSLWMMEKEHELAVEYVECFMREFHKLRPASSRERMWKTASLLLQACYILKSHIEKEEKLVFPLVEQVLTDVDYLFL